MKKRNSLLYLAFSGVLLFGACTEETDVRGDKPEYDTTPMHFSFSTTPMDVIGDAGNANTRAKVTKKEDKSAGMDVEIGGTTASTRSVTGTVNESVIHEVSIFQFEEGTNGKLLYQSDVAGGTSGSTSVDAALVSKSAVTPVCVVANLGALTSVLGLEVNTTTRAQFEQKVALQLTAENNLIAGDDLPMMGWDETVNVSSSNAANVTLSYMVAKVVLDCKLMNGASVKNMTIKMKNVPNGITIKAPTAAPADPGAGTYLEFTGVTCADNAAFEAVNDLTWYVPESKRTDSDNALIVDSKDRCENLAPKNSMYIEIAGTYVFSDGDCPVVYQIFLGSEPANVKNFTVERGKQYKVTATIKGLNVADSRILVGTDLSPWDATNNRFKTANCYMVPTAAGKWYRFKGTIQGNGRTDDDFTPQIGADASKPEVPGWAVNAVEMKPTYATVLWQTSDKASSGDAVGAATWSKNGYVVFNTKADGEEGNAVIAVKESAAGDILWSWHIWKTAYVPDKANAGTVDVYKVRNNKTGLYDEVAPWKTRDEIVMTRNLGAANNNPGNRDAGGLLYQWGRKDPFVGSIDFKTKSSVPYPTVSSLTWYDGSTGAGHAAASKAPAVGVAAVEVAIKNPMSFYTQQSENTFDWVAGSRVDQNDNLWGNPNRQAAPDKLNLANQDRGKKSIYDPCPDGWRVAPQDTWTSFTKNYSGTYVPSTGASKEVSYVGGNNFGTGEDAWKAWNVVGNEAGKNPTLKDLQDNNFTANCGWQFYCQKDGEGPTVYFPASGYRWREAGSLLSGASEGSCWSSSSLCTGEWRSMGLLISTARIEPLALLTRGVGRPVRCVQE